MKPETKSLISKMINKRKGWQNKDLTDNAEVTPPHTGKMYFSGRKRASRFPKTCEAEQRPVIQLKAAALLLPSTTSACQRKGKCDL